MKAAPHSLRNDKFLTFPSNYKIISLKSTLDFQRNKVFFMKDYLPILLRCPLFNRIDETDLLRLLHCLRAQLVHVPKGASVLRQGDPVRHFGLLLEGGLQVVRTDAHGLHSILNIIHPAELFAEAFTFAHLTALPASVYATCDSTVLLMEPNLALAACSKGCIAHSRLVVSILHSIASKNLRLNSKLEVVTQRTTREKILTFLRQQQSHAGVNPFTIPFNRQEMADYLAVDRTALSAELSRLQSDGLIRFHKSTFELVD